MPLSTFPLFVRLLVKDKIQYFVFVVPIRNLKEHYFFKKRKINQLISCGVVDKLINTPVVDTVDLGRSRKDGKHISDSRKYNGIFLSPAFKTMTMNIIFMRF